jgi:hypothetical protein
MKLSSSREANVAIWQHCYPYFPESPSRRSTACNVPPVARLAVGPGLRTTTDALRDEAWSAAEWELYVDGRRVNLTAFGPADAELDQRPLTKLRSWNVLLETPTAGAHTLHVVLHLGRAQSDGVRIAPAGRYELEVNFTIGE